MPVARRVEPSRAIRVRLVLVCAMLLATLGALTAVAGEEAVVKRVLDGDTIEVELEGRATTVRLIGVDTPEVGSRRDPTVRAEPYGVEASAFTRDQLAGQRVRLERDPSAGLDRYGRTLAYVFLPDGTFFNRELVRRGYGRAITRFKFRYREEFQAEEELARSERRGLWADAAPAATGPVIGNLRSRIYHLPGQAYYDRISPADRVYFQSEAAARAAGYRAARR